MKNAKDGLAAGPSTATEWFTMTRLIRNYDPTRHEDAGEVLSKLLDELGGDVITNHTGFAQLFGIIFPGKVTLKGGSTVLSRSCIVIHTQFAI